MARTLTINDVPERLYNLIKLNAKENNRSLNDEIVTSLKTKFGRKNIGKENYLADVRALRNFSKDFRLDDEIFKQPKNNGSH